MALWLSLTVVLVPPSCQSDSYRKQSIDSLTYSASSRWIWERSKLSLCKNHLPQFHLHMEQQPYTQPRREEEKEESTRENRENTWVHSYSLPASRRRRSYRNMKTVTTCSLTDSSLLNWWPSWTTSFNSIRSFESRSFQYWLSFNHSLRLPVVSICIKLAAQCIVPYLSLPYPFLAPPPPPCHLLAYSCICTTSIDRSTRRDGGNSRGCALTTSDDRWIGRVTVHRWTDERARGWTGQI